jgi:hypothetical protein
MEEALIEASTMRLLAVPPDWPAALCWQHQRKGSASTQRQKDNQD